MDPSTCCRNAGSCTALVRNAMMWRWLCSVLSRRPCKLPISCSEACRARHLGSSPEPGSGNPYAERCSRPKRKKSSTLAPAVAVSDGRAPSLTRSCLGASFRLRLTTLQKSRPATHLFVRTAGTLNKCKSSGLHSSCSGLLVPSEPTSIAEFPPLTEVTSVCPSG